MNPLKKTNITKLQKLGLTDTADKINEMVELLNFAKVGADSECEEHIWDETVYNPTCHKCGKRMRIDNKLPVNYINRVEFANSGGKESGLKLRNWLSDFKDESWADNFDKAFPCESEMCKTGCICGMAEIKDFIYETIIGERRIAYQKGKEDYYNQTRRQNKEAKLETAKVNFEAGEKQLAQDLLDHIRDDIYYEKEDIKKFLKKIK